MSSTGEHGERARSGMVLVVAGETLRASLHLLEPWTHLEVRERLGTRPEGCDVVLADYDHLDSSERDALLDMFHGPAGRMRLLLVSEKDCRQDFPRLFRSHTLTNLLAKNGELDPANLQTTVRKLLHGNIFGIHRYLSEDAPLRSLQATRSTQKTDVLQMMEAFAGEHRLKAWLLRLLYSVADEFFTNAIYNAPTDAEGKHRYSHLARSEEVVLAPGEGISVKIATDGRQVGVAVRDPFGSLAPDRLLDYLAKCFRREDDQVDDKPGGAGLGFYTVFESLSQFVVNIAPGHCTEMIGLFDVERSYRDFASRGKSFNIFMTEKP